MSKSNVYALTGTILTGTVIFLILLFTIIPVTIKMNDIAEEGIMVSFGEVEEGGGTNPDREAMPISQPVTQTSVPAAPQKQASEELVTQNDNSNAIAEQKKKEKREKEALERQQQEELRIANEKRRGEQAATDKANSTINGLFGNSNTKGSGNSTGDGRQGNPAGSGNSGGNSWSLNGRVGNGELSEPTEIFQEGVVKVSIIVDSKGNVISAKATGGNISDSRTKRLVEAAAYKSKFPPGEGEAKGTINYILRFSNK